MTANMERIQQRNKEIGNLLKSARNEQHRSISECAAVLATSRRRYTDIEQGKIGIGAAEFELLVEYFHLHQISPILQTKDQLTGETRRVRVQAQPGEAIEIILDVVGPVPAASL